MLYSTITETDILGIADKKDVSLKSKQAKTLHVLPIKIKITMKQKD